MFGLSPLVERLVWVVLVGLFVVLTVWYERRQGAEKCELADARVALIQKAAQQAQEAIDAKRLKDAQDVYQTELVTLKRLHDTEPVTHVVCLQARTKRLSKAPSVSEAQPAAPGTLPPEGPRDTRAEFDPGPALDALHDEADQLIAKCRELDASVPHPR